MAKHDFGIMGQFNENMIYSVYEPEKYNCISVDMQIMNYVMDNYRSLQKQTSPKKQQIPK